MLIAGEWRVEGGDVMGRLAHDLRDSYCSER
jgi:hypothetical protein